MKPFTSLLLCLLTCVTSAFATHLKGAELTAQRNASSAFTYIFMLVIYEESSGVTEGAASLDVGNRVSVSLNLNTQQLVADGVMRKVFTASYTFPAAGSYKVAYTGSNRNYSVNIPDATAAKLYIELQLLINPVTGINNLPAFTKTPHFIATAGEKFTDDYSATDAEGDSLSYKMVTPFNIVNYTYPSKVGGDTESTFAIDSHTGAITWDAPKYIGNYIITVQVEEWRQGIKTGIIYRDIQITVTGNGPAIGPPAEERTFNFFPNPANDKVFFTLPDANTSAVMVEIWTIKGQLLSRQESQIADNMRGIIELAQYPAGIYVIKIASANAFFTRKLIIIH